GLLIGVFNMAPRFQCISNIALNSLMILYFSIFRPYEKVFDGISEILNELILLTVNGCILALTYIDHTNSDNNRPREILGYLVIYLNLGFMLKYFVVTVVWIIRKTVLLCKFIS